jgi:hypothetical protein
MEIGKKKLDFWRNKCRTSWSFEGIEFHPQGSVLL